MPDGSRVATQRAYSLLTIKSVDDEQRIIEGIASTPTADRMGDIVEPKGAQFKLPIPLLWQHDSEQPIGHVIAAKVTAGGISITAQIAKGVLPAIDNAWALIKSGLVRGLSIGFLGIESEPIDPKNPYFGGTKFLSWDWLELSCVTIPANSEASIQNIKSLDTQQRAASGALPLPVVRLSSPPGASGKSPQLPKETIMPTPVTEQISAFENKRAATMAQMDDIMSKAATAGLTLDAAQTEQYDTLNGEVKAIDGHLVRLKEHELRLKNTLAPINDPHPQIIVPPTVPVITGVTTRLEPGIKMARWVQAQWRAKELRQDIASIVQTNKEWMSSSPELLTVAKAAVAAGDTTTSGWASELVYNQNLVNEFINYLRPMTIIGRVAGWRRAPFNIRVGSATGGSTGYWVGQGAAAPVSKMTTSSVTMGIAKAVGLAAMDKELLMSSSPSAELLIRDDLAKAVQFLLDVSLIDPNQGGTANTQPASLTYGATTTQASGPAYANLKTDVQATFAPFISANMDTSQGVWIMSPTTALALSMMVTSLGVPQFPEMSINGGTLFGLPVVVSQSAYISGSPDYANMIVLLFPNEVFLADDGQVTIEMSDQTAIQLLDNPTNASTGGTTATSLVSMFQTSSVAIKATRFINWKAARTNVAAVIRTAAYV